MNRVRQMLDSPLMFIDLEKGLYDQAKRQMMSQRARNITSAAFQAHKVGTETHSEESSSVASSPMPPKPKKPASTIRGTVIRSEGPPSWAQKGLFSKKPKMPKPASSGAEDLSPKERASAKRPGVLRTTAHALLRAEVPTWIDSYKTLPREPKAKAPKTKVANPLTEAKKHGVAAKVETTTAQSGEKGDHRKAAHLHMKAAQAYHRAAKANPASTEAQQGLKHHLEMAKYHAFHAMKKSEAAQRIQKASNYANAAVHASKMTAHARVTGTKAAHQEAMNAHLDAIADAPVAQHKYHQKMANAHAALFHKSYVGFDKLKEKLSGKVKNPGAVAASIGRKKYGKKKFQAAAASKHKKMRGMHAKKCMKCMGMAKCMCKSVAPTWLARV